MMTDEQRIEWLLELQEHPASMTDKEHDQIMADKETVRLVRQLSFAKRAFKHDAQVHVSPDVDAEWEAFERSHAAEMDALTTGEERKRGFAWLHVPHKVAASLIGVLLASGIAFAAIHVVRNIGSPRQKPAAIAQPSSTGNVPSLQVDAAEADSIAVEPCVFNNVTLDSMLTVIAAAHGTSVQFANEAAQALRFHFVWKRDDSLARVVEKLNTFEVVSIGMDEGKLVVR